MTCKYESAGGCPVLVMTITELPTCMCGKVVESVAGAVDWTVGCKACDNGVYAPTEVEAIAYWLSTQGGTR